MMLWPCLKQCCPPRPRGVRLAPVSAAVLSVRVASRLAPSDALVDASLDVALQPPAKVLEHGRAAGEHDVLIEAAARVDRRRLETARAKTHPRHAPQKRNISAASATDLGGELREDAERAVKGRKCMGQEKIS
eukprot:6193978-Pleurochrysis_carterae.AAC.2